MMLQLWWWALDNAQDGDLSDCPAGLLAQVMEWRSKRKAELPQLLQQAGFLDDALRLVDWEQFTGRLFEKREQARQRQKHRRDKALAEDVTRDTRACSALTVQSPYRNRTVPLYNDDGGDAPARETECGESTVENAVENCGEYPDSPEGEAEELLESVSQHKQTLREIRQLPPEISQRFHTALQHAFTIYFTREPTEYDKTILYRLLRLLHQQRGTPLPPLQMTDDDIQLLDQAFEAAANAGVKKLSYIWGVFRRLRERGIATADAYWEFQFQRDITPAPNSSKKRMKPA